VDLPQRAELVPIIASPRVPSSKVLGAGASLQQVLALATSDSRDPVVVRWPARHLSARALRRWFGESTVLQQDPNARRLTLQAGSLGICGLPAVWVAMTRRCHTARVLSWLMIPLAFGVEQLRAGLQPDH
jgi:hypothetical protein